MNLKDIRDCLNLDNKNLERFVKIHLKRKYDKLVRLFNKDKQEAALKRKNKGKLVFIKIDLKKNVIVYIL